MNDEERVEFARFRTEVHNDIQHIRFSLEGDPARGFMGIRKRLEITEIKMDQNTKDFKDFRDAQVRMMAKIKNIGLGIAICLVLIALLLGYISLSDVKNFISTAL